MVSVKAVAMLQKDMYSLCRWSVFLKPVSLSSRYSKNYSGLPNYPVGVALPNKFSGGNLAKEQDKKTLKPFTYISQLPHVHIRTALGRALNHWLKIPEGNLSLIVEIVQMIHDVSLLLDDIEDNSVMRRGSPAAHCIYGIASSINAGVFANIIALEKLVELKKIELIEIFAEELAKLGRGQGIEIYWRETFTCPSEEEYMQMSIDKTGALFLLLARVMQQFSDNKCDFTVLMDTLAMYSQVYNDYLNLNSPEYMESKSYCEDITEGKFSFPIIHAIRSRPEDSRVMDILRQKTKDVEVKRYCVSLLKEYGSFEYTRSVLSKLKEQAHREIKDLGANPHMDEVLRLLELE